MINRFTLPASLLFSFVFFQIASGSTPEYFQQRADHEIHVRLDDVAHLLHCHINTSYTNNSPDTLFELYVHLYPNAYSSKETAFAKQQLQNGNTDFYFAKPHEMGFIDSLDFRVDGLRVTWGLDAKNPDIGILYLNEPLLPGQMIMISTPFRVKFPDSRFSRLGHDGQAYYATQWYPKPAVYDQNGWNAMPYLDIGEFYSNFGDVDVFLSLPQNYIVASTGRIINAEENRWLDSLAADNFFKHKAEGLKPRLNFPPSSPKIKTIHLRQENVHDFAWFADKRFYILRGVMIIPGTQKNVIVGAYFYNDADQWEHALTYAAQTLAFMSEQVMVYPWDTKSVVQGINSAGAGMEYPAATLIGKAATDVQLERVIVHETIHNWFYGILASNEREHPWLDEGFTSYYEDKFMSRKHPDFRLLGEFSKTSLAQYFNLSELRQRDLKELLYLYKARRNLDQPVNLPAHEYSMLNYFGMTYYKASLALKYLETYIGSDAFDRVMKQYGENWSFKHPAPEDVRHLFESNTPKDLSWFFDDLIGSSKKIDYSISKVTSVDPGHYEILVTNKGRINSPIPVSGVKNGQVVHTQWYEGFEGKQTLAFPKGDYDLIRIDHEKLVPDLYRDNNTYWLNKTFPRMNPLKLQILGGIEDQENTRLYFLPLAGWNNYNGFMGGVALYNSFFPARPTEWFIMPMYAFGNKSLAGTARINHHFYPERGFIHEYRLGANAKRYAFTPGADGWEFKRYEASVRAALRKNHAASSISRHLSLKSVLINRDIPLIVNGTVQPQKSHYLLNQASFSYFENRVINPYSFQITMEQGKRFVKVSGESRLFFHYPGMKKGFDLRFFAGTFLIKPEQNSQIDYRFRLGSHRGIHNYDFGTTFLGRMEAAGTFWGNQVAEADGGFKFPTSVGQTWDWLAAANLKAALPFVPAKIYFDAGTYAGAANAFSGSKPISWVLGIQVAPIKNVLEINFPLAVSSDIEQVAGFAFDNYFQRVTFSLYLDRLNPFRYLRDLRVENLRQT